MTRRTRTSSRQEDAPLASLSLNFLHRTISVVCCLSSIMPLSSATGYHRSCAGSIRHVHLAVGRDPASQMTISFSSVRSFHVPLIGGVFIGTSPDDLSVYLEEPEPARKYNATHFNPKNGQYYSPYLHHITIHGLDASTTYYYKCNVRRRHEEPPMSNFTTTANLRGTTTTRSSGIDVDIEGEAPPDYDDDENEDDDPHGENDTDPIRQRWLDLNYYDTSSGVCPNPNKIRSFRTAPPPGTMGPSDAVDATKSSHSSTDEPFLKFAFLGDIGQFDHSLENIEHFVNHQLNSGTLDAIMLAGDIAYTGYDSRRWDTFFDLMDDYGLIDQIPMQVCAGNHDIDKQDNDTDIFLAYEHRFRMPEVAPAQLGTYDGPLGRLNMDTPPYPLPYEFGNAYYAFTYGISHHIFLNTYSSMEPNSTQYRWLKYELKRVNRAVTPWLVVTLHVPLYNSFDVHRKDLQIKAARDHLEPLFVQFNVNLVVTGHIHAYQRTHPVVNDKVNATGPVHITVGAGGRQCKASFLEATPEEWVAVRDATRYGYGTLTLFNHTHAQWEWHQTGHSEYQSTNLVSNSNETQPPFEGPDVLLLENQLFVGEG